VQSRCRYRSRRSAADLREQFNARQADCAKLGEGPYDPVIAPANFVSRITNPYYPLPVGRTWLYEGQSVMALCATLSP